MHMVAVCALGLSIGSCRGDSERPCKPCKPCRPCKCGSREPECRPKVWGCYSSCAVKTASATATTELVLEATGKILVPDLRKPLRRRVPALLRLGGIRGAGWLQVTGCTRESHHHGLFYELNIALKEKSDRLTAGMGVMLAEQFIDPRAIVEIRWRGKDELHLDVRGKADNVRMRILVPVKSARVAYTFRRMKLGIPEPK